MQPSVYECMYIANFPENCSHWVLFCIKGFYGLLISNTSFEFRYPERQNQYGGTFIEIL